MSKTTQAIETLQHYFQVVWEKAGLIWAPDNAAEVAMIVDSIIDAAREEK